MNDLQQKKWASFEEMYNDLKNTDHYKNSIKKSTADSISNLIKQIELAQTGKDFFNCTCKLSSIFESLDRDSIEEIYRKTNVYVLVLNAVFRNVKFVSVLSDLLCKNEKIDDLKRNKEYLEKLIFLNTALSLAFLGIALNYQSINSASIEFLRKNITDLLKYILRQTSAKETNFINTCYFLEKAAWDNRLHYNENFESKFPVKLNGEFLFNNLKTSRSFAGITFTSLVIRPVIENSFKKIISNFNEEKFSISFALDSIFDVANELDGKINHYYHDTPKDVSGFFDVFIKNNEKNLIYCVKKFCSGFHFQGKEKKFFEIILDKLKIVDTLKKDFIDYTKNNFRAFNKGVGDENDEWTNKLFLISIKTLSILEEVRSAIDSKWIVSVAVYEFRQWLVEIHEVLNRYYIEDDWEKIKEYVIQENEKVEWKSSFYLPMEQEYLDEISDSGISRRLFEKILKVILGMINTDGGVLLIGMVENPDAIKRSEVNEFFIKKNELTFFDINYELKKYRKTLDDVRLQVLDNLKQVTDSPADKFNGLIKFDPIILRGDSRVISIVKILIKKSSEPFFNVKKEGNSIWLSLTKRAQGQNVDVDIRDHI